METLKVKLIDDAYYQGRCPRCGFPFSVRKHDIDGLAVCTNATMGLMGTYIPAHFISFDVEEKEGHPIEIID